VSNAPGYEPKPTSEAELEKANADLDAPDRVARGNAAVAMRIAGATYTDIARTLEYTSPTHARQAVERSLAASAGTEGREQMRFLEARRLERILRGLWTKATSDTIMVKGQEVDNPDHLAYARTAIAVIDRHARLYGLDAPQEMVIYNPSGAELEAWVAKMARQVHGELPDEYDIIEGHAIDDPVGDDD
jgi:hypothetical protein